MHFCDEVITSKCPTTRVTFRHMIIEFAYMPTCNEDSLRCDGRAVNFDNIPLRGPMFEPSIVQASPQSAPNRSEIKQASNATMNLESRQDYTAPSQHTGQALKALLLVAHRALGGRFATSSNRPDCLTSSGLRNPRKCGAHDYNYFANISTNR